MFVSKNFLRARGLLFRMTCREVFTRGQELFHEMSEQDANEIL